MVEILVLTIADPLLLHHKVLWDNHPNLSASSAINSVLRGTAHMLHTQTFFSKQFLLA